MNRTPIDFTTYQNVPKRFKCDTCKSRGLTLVENRRDFLCQVCGKHKPLNFWHKRFVKAPERMTLREASKIIGTGESGSTLRRARLEGRLKTSGRLPKNNGDESDKEHLVNREELILFYLTRLNKRPKTKKDNHNGTQKEI